MESSNLKEFFHSLNLFRNIFECSYCSKGFSERKDCRKHIISIHERENLPFKCHLCDYGSMRTKTLAMHLHMKHGISNNIVLAPRKSQRGVMVVSADFFQDRLQMRKFKILFNLLVLANPKNVNFNVENCLQPI